MSGASIRSLIVALLLALAVPLTAIIAFALAREYRTSAERAESAAVELAVATANGVRQVLDGGYAVVGALSRDPAILSLDAPSCAPWLREVDAMQPQFANIVVTDASGTVVCSARPMGDELPNVADREWFAAARDGVGPVTGRYQVGNVTGRAIVVVAHALRGPDGAVRGVVAAGIDLDHFQHLLDGLPQPPDAIVTLADDEWTVLARSREAARWIGQTLPGDTVPERRIGPGIGIFKATGLDGIGRVFGFATVDGPSWRVYAGVPQAWIYGPVREAAIRRGAFVAAVLAGVALLTLLLFRRVAQSLWLVVEGTRAAAAPGGARVPEVGPAEVVAVARALNATLSARERAETESRRARQRFESVLRNAPYGIFVCTPGGQLLDVNPALVRMLGYPSEEALHGVDARTPFQDPARFEALVARAMAGDHPRDEELEWRRFDGGRVLVRLSCGAAITAVGGRVIEVMAEDVTERRALEEHLLATRKMEAIGRLAGGVAHDFNNLLTIVRGQAQFLLMELGEDEPAAEHATEIIEATQRGARLTRQLLAFGRRQPIQPVPLDLNDIVRNLQTMLRRVLGEEAALVLRLGDVPPVSADPGQVEQIVLNLVFNARDAMPEGGEVVIETAFETLSEDDCRGRPGARAGEFILLTVSDTGEGIQPDVLDRLFEPFFTTKQQGRGTGLGLATVYGIVSQNGGWIEVESAPGTGASFTVHLPRVLELGVTADDQAEPIDELFHGTVLVAEDEEAVRKVVVGTLRQGGYRVLEAGSGDEALRVAAAHDDPVELLVTDEMMPGMRGTQLASELIARGSGLRVLFMSGYADRIPAGDRYAGAPSAFLGKPFSQEQLLQQVARLLRRDLVTTGDRLTDGTTGNAERTA